MTDDWYATWLSKLTVRDDEAFLPDEPEPRRLRCSRCRRRSWSDALTAHDCGIPMKHRSAA